MPLPQPPTNGTDTTRVLMILDDEVRNLDADTGLASVSAE